jgi:hypothetical protein
VKYPYIQPTRTPLWKRAAKWLASVALTLVFIALGVVVLAEWLAGCGETYTDSKGVTHANECLFLNR